MREGPDAMPVLLTIAEVAQRMGISKSGVYRRIAGGDLRAIRISDRAMRVLESDLQAYVDPVGPELTVREAATVLRLSTSMVYELIREGRLATTERGSRRLRVLRSELEAYIEGRPMVTEVPESLFGR